MSLTPHSLTHRVACSCDNQWEEPPHVFVHELCRYLAAVARDDVLATDAECRVSVDPRCRQLLLLDLWCHPDVAQGELPSQTETFQQLARVLETGDAAHYRPTSAPNTHWRNWSESGQLDIGERAALHQRVTAQTGFGDASQ